MRDSPSRVMMLWAAGGGDRRGQAMHRRKAGPQSLVFWGSSCVLTVWGLLGVPRYLGTPDIGLYLGVHLGTGQCGVHLGRTDSGLHLRTHDIRPDLLT